MTIISENNEANFDLSSIFISRNRQLAEFRSLLTRWMQDKPKRSKVQNAVFTPTSGNRLPGPIVILYGRGGFGKSTLLQHYRNISLEYGGRIKISQILDWETAIQDKTAVFRSLDEEVGNSLRYFNILISQLAQVLNKKPESFKGYRIAAKAVIDAENQAVGVLKSLQADDRFVWLREGVSGLAVTLLREIFPGGHVILNETRSEKLKNILGEGVKFGAEEIAALRVKLQNKLGNALDDYLEPDRRLALGLGRDLLNIAGWHRLLIFFDTYEEVDEVDNLLRLVAMSAGNRVGWVIAGRNNLWAGRDQRLRTLDGSEYGYRDIVSAELGLAIPFTAEGEGEFTQGDIELYFEQLNKATNCPLLKKKDAKRLVEITRGIPLAVKVAASIYLETKNIDVIVEPFSSEESEIVDVMVRRYLFHARHDMQERAKLYGLALLRRDDQPLGVATAIGLSPEEIDIKYDTELRRLHRRYSFIFTEKEQPSLHQDVRYFLRRWLLERQHKPEVASVNKKILETHMNVFLGLEDRRHYANLQERFEDNTWTSAYLNLTEQYFWLDSVEGVRHAIPFMIAASIYNRYIIVEMINVGVFFEKTLVSHDVKKWNAAAVSLLHNNSRNSTAEALDGLHYLDTISTSLIGSVPEPFLKFRHDLQAAIWWRLGEAYLGKDDYQSVEWYDKALLRLPKNPSLRSDAASATYYAAIRSYKESDNEKAVEYFNKAAKLDPKNASIFFRIGRTYTTMGKDSVAIDYYHKALEIDPHSAEVSRGLATSYRYIDIRKATKYAIQATKLNNSDPDSFDYLGILYRDQLLIDEAIAAHEQARNIDPQPTTRFLLSLLYAHKKDYGRAYAEIVEANEALKNEEYQIRTRTVWALLYQWSQYIMEGNHNEAMKISEQIKKFITTPRTAKVVVGHMSFLLNAYNCSDRLEIYIDLIGKHNDSTKLTG